MKMKGLEYIDCLSQHILVDGENEEEPDEDSISSALTAEEQVPYILI